MCGLRTIVGQQWLFYPWILSKNSPSSKRKFWSFKTQNKQNFKSGIFFFNQLEQLEGSNQLAFECFSAIHLPHALISSYHHSLQFHVLQSLFRFHFLLLLFNFINQENMDTHRGPTPHGTKPMISLQHFSPYFCAI